MKGIPQTLTSTKGIIIVNAEGILPEFGDIERFDNYADLAKHVPTSPASLRSRKQCVCASATSIWAHYLIQARLTLYESITQRLQNLLPKETMKSRSNQLRGVTFLVFTLLLWSTLIHSA